MPKAEGTNQEEVPDQIVEVVKTTLSAVLDDPNFSKKIGLEVGIEKNSMMAYISEIGINYKMKLIVLASGQDTK